jgi:hypothetical protein
LNSKKVKIKKEALNGRGQVLGLAKLNKSTGHPAPEGGRRLHWTALKVKQSQFSGITFSEESFIAV